MDLPLRNTKPAYKRMKTQLVVFSAFCLELFINRNKVMKHQQENNSNNNSHKKKKKKREKNGKNCNNYNVVRARQSSTHTNKHTYIYDTLTSQH